ncbi:hypothetical protein EDD17DRAFT_1757189 [Pisolithus thermaeus]|nr:hypothetical protein EDD17DRAFT_1757189 [Pisolithus thermaeus]
MLECTQIIAAIQDHGPYRLHFKFEPNSKLDLLTSKKAVIIGTPPLHDSKSSRAKRIFYNGKTDYDGPAHLPNPAKTQIKRQVGGRKTTNRTAEDDGHSSSSPSPIPRMLHSTMHKAAVGERDSSGKGARKSMYGHRKVEVVVTMMAKKLGKQMPSIITIGDSSEPGETNIGVGEDASDNYAQLFLSDDEQGPSTRKHKANSQQSLHPTKRVASLLNMNTTQLSNLKVTKVPSQARTAPKKRLWIISLFNSDSSSEERLLRAITARDSSMKQLASSPESDTIQLPSPKVMNASPQTRLATKKNKLWFISPLSSELSSEKELGSDPPRDEPNATSSKASIDHQQPSVEIHIKQSMHTQLTLSLPQEKRLSDMPSHHDELLNLPSQEPLCNEETQFQQPSCWVQEDQQSSRTSSEHHAIQLPSEPHQEPPQPKVQLQFPQPHIHVGQSATSNPIPGASHPEHHSGELFNLHQRIYPGTSKAESMILSSAASARLLAVEEGYVGVSPGERGMEPEPPAGELPGELYLGQPHLPLPHHQHDPQMNRDHQLQVNVGADRMYSRDDQFSYDGIPYHLSMNPGWYDPSHRGSEVRYGPYHLQFILPPPFTAHCYPAHGYANDPTIHWPPSAKGFGHHTNVPPPFYGAHETEYANVSGSHDLPVRAYRQTQVYDLPSNASALLGTQGGLKHSAGTHQDAVLDSTDPPAGSNIASTRDV